MIEIQYNPETKLWDKRKEPYATIEVATEKDYELLVERIENHTAKKPIGVDWDFEQTDSTRPWSYPEYACPVCKKNIISQELASKIPKMRPNYCGNCGQKIDWSEVDVTE